MSLGRNSRRLLNCAFIFALAALAAGCSFSMGQMAALSTLKVEVPTQTLAREVEGKNCVWIIGPLPLGLSAVPNLASAEDDAIAKVAGGNAMENMVVREDVVSYVVGMRECFRVAGDVVKVEQQASAGACP